jgi:hypothetical protein
MIPGEEIKDLNKWEARKRDWVVRVLVAGCTGFLGSIVTVVSEMEFLKISNFFELNVGTYFILLLWLVGTAVAAPGVWLFCKAKVTSAETKIADKNKPQSQ